MVFTEDGWKSLLTSRVSSRFCTGINDNMSCLTRKLGWSLCFGYPSGSRPVTELVSTQMAAETLGSDQLGRGIATQPAVCKEGLLSRSVVLRSFFFFPLSSSPKLP